jgi:hypothetical protein
MATACSTTAVEGKLPACLLVQLQLSSNSKMQAHWNTMATCTCIPRHNGGAQHAHDTRHKTRQCPPCCCKCPKCTLAPFVSALVAQPVKTPSVNNSKTPAYNTTVTNPQKGPAYACACDTHIMPAHGRNAERCGKTAALSACLLFC